MEKEKKVWVQIINNGEIELGGLHLMGVSSKRGDSEKIGFFGSGNKYAIALLLREKIPFKIFSGKKEIKISTKDIMFREKMYEQIVINGESTSLTTSMGIDWETWFAIRELYCNALDEGGSKLSVIDKPIAIAGKTIVYVQLTDKLGEFFKEIDKYILTNKDTVIESAKTQYGGVHFINSNSKEFIAFRKGIRIFPKNEIKSLYWYNFSDITINESRVYQYEHEVLERIASGLARTKNCEIINNYLRNWKDAYEQNAKWEYTENDKLSDEWHGILLGNRIYPENLAIHSGDFEGKLNSFIVPDKLAEKIAKQFPDIEVVGHKNGKHYEVVEMSDTEKQQINQALEDLKNIGYTIIKPIKIVMTTTEDVIAWYDRKEDIIFHSRKYLNTSSKSELKNTLLEEHFHTIGYVDGQRSFSTFLIDELIKAKENA